MLLKKLWHLLPFPLRHWIGGRFISDTLYPLAIKAIDRLVDYYYAVDTCHNQKQVEVAKATANIPLGYLSLYSIRKALALRENDVVSDLGSGDGRALFVFANSFAREVRGIELDHMAILKCEDNLKKFNRRDIVRIIRDDCAGYKFSDETVVYLFNPFKDDNILKSVLANIEFSLRVSPRPLRVCFVGPPSSAAVLENTIWLEKASLLKFYKLSGAIYRSIIPLP